MAQASFTQENPHDRFETFFDTIITELDWPSHHTNIERTTVGENDFAYWGIVEGTRIRSVEFSTDDGTTVILEELTLDDDLAERHGVSDQQLNLRIHDAQGQPVNDREIFDAAPEEYAAIRQWIGRALL